MIVERRKLGFCTADAAGVIVLMGGAFNQAASYWTEIGSNYMFRSMVTLMADWADTGCRVLWEDDT
jgi:hypothetical protein